MRLNKEDRKELREKIEEVLKKVPDGGKIHLDKELLEQLIFDQYKEQLSSSWGEFSGQKVLVKYVVWSGDFLSKIDLGEVSFDDVIWDVSYDPEGCFEGKPTYKYKDVKHINLSNTNAKIDFSKSLHGKYYTEENGIIIKYCDFANTNLSNNFIDCDCEFESSDFSNTGLKLSMETTNRVCATDCNFSGLDFSDHQVSELFFDDCAKSSYADNCNFSNTGLQISTVKVSPVIIRAHNSYYSESSIGLSADERNTLFDIFKDYYLVLSMQSKIGEEIKNGHLNGCYVNKKLIKSSEQRKIDSKTKKIEYGRMKAELINNSINSIEKQAKVLSLNGISKKS